MLKIILSLKMLLLCCCIQAQSYKDVVRVQFSDYTNALINKNFEKAVEYINPDFFTIISKDQFIKIMQSAFDNKEVNIEISKSTIDSMKDKITINGRDYLKLYFSQFMMLNYISEDGEILDTIYMKRALGEEFAPENVTYNSKTDQYKVFMTSLVIADSRNGKNWTFTVIEEDKLPILKKFLPAQLLLGVL